MEEYLIQRNLNNLYNVSDTERIMISIENEIVRSRISKSNK